MMKEELRNYEMLSYVCPCRPALLCLLFILFFCLHFFHYHMKLPIMYFVLIIKVYVNSFSVTAKTRIQKLVQARDLPKKMSIYILVQTTLRVG